MLNLLKMMFSKKYRAEVSERCTNEIINSHYYTEKQLEKVYENILNEIKIAAI